MLKLLKLNLLIVIVLLSYSTSWSQNNVTIHFTGVLEPTDTLVEVPLNTLRIANSKMLELKFEKEINGNLRQIITNDSIVINSLQTKVAIEQNNAKKYKKQRNVVGGTGVGLLILLIISIL